MTLRVVFFVHEFPALSETFVLNQVTGFLDLGCDVHILSARRRDEGVTHPDVARYGLMRLTTYIQMPARRLARLRAAVSVFSRRFRADPKQALQAINVFRYGRAAFSLELLFWLERLAETRNSFDVIYCHFGIVGRKAAFLREIGAIKGGLVTTFHGVDVSATLRKRPNLYRHLFETGDLFLPISDRWRRHLIERGCSLGRTDVHHMGVDLTRFATNPAPRDAEAPLRILIIGRQVEKKGIEYGLRAIAEARERGIPLSCTVIGDGPLRGSLEALTDKLDINRDVTFCGWQDQNVVAEQLRGHDVILAPSVTDSDGDQEGIPVTLMEAMASGLAVVSTRHSGIPELVVDEESGLLSNERDVNGLADSLERLFRDPALYARLQRAGRDAVSREFDVKKLNARLVRIFTGLGGGATTGKSARGDRTSLHSRMPVDDLAAELAR